MSQYFRTVSYPRFLASLSSKTKGNTATPNAPIVTAPGLVWRSVSPLPLCFALQCVYTVGANFVWHTKGVLLTLRVSQKTLYNIFKNNFNPISIYTLQGICFIWFWQLSTQPISPYASIVVQCLIENSHSANARKPQTRKQHGNTRTLGKYKVW